MSCSLITISSTGMIYFSDWGVTLGLGRKLNIDLGKEKQL